MKRTNEDKLILVLGALEVIATMPHNQGNGMRAIAQGILDTIKGRKNESTDTKNDKQQTRNL